MIPTQTPTLVRWGRVAVVAAVAIAAVWAFALITPTHELDSEAFLSQVFAHAAEVRSAHFAQWGSVTMSDGVVHKWSGEGDFVYTGDSQGFIEYEECSFPIGMDLYLCSIEWVELGGVRYEKANTSEGRGEWEVIDDMQMQPSPSGRPYDTVDLLEYWSRGYGLVESRGDSAGVEYRVLRGDYSPSRLMLERLEAGEWEPPAEVSRELFIADLERQAEVETGTRELWARTDNGAIWMTIDEVERTEVDGRDSLGAPTSIKTSSIIEYSRYNEPVVVKPPI